ncbi:MAG: hypothetical protein ACPKPY_12895 [Nitrososphaeraceae archaeon]
MNTWKAHGVSQHVKSKYCCVFPHQRCYLSTNLGPCIHPLDNHFNSDFIAPHLPGMRK